jgi:hypothetical protein
VEVIPFWHLIEVVYEEIYPLVITGIFLLTGLSIVGILKLIISLHIGEILKNLFSRNKFLCKVIDYVLNIIKS